MEYPIEIEIDSRVDDVSRKRIELALNGGTLLAPIFPKIGMPLNLKSGIRILMIDVIPNQREAGKTGAVAWALVRPFLSTDSRRIE